MIVSLYILLSCILLFTLLDASTFKHIFSAWLRACLPPETVWLWLTSSRNDGVSVGRTPGISQSGLSRATRSGACQWDRGDFRTRKWSCAITRDLHRTVFVKSQLFCIRCDGRSSVPPGGMTYRMTGRQYYSHKCLARLFEKRFAFKLWA